MIGGGIFTVYQGIWLRFKIEGNNRRLVYWGTESPRKDFEKKADGIYILNVRKEEVTNAFFLDTKCIYKGSEFDVERHFDGGIVSLSTSENEAYQTLALEHVGKGDYRCQVHKSELEKVWEVRKKVPDDLPFPGG